MRSPNLFRVAALLLLASLLSGCGYNQIQQKDEAVTAGWSEVLNQYQRRADLIPNLVNTVKGYAAHEQQVLTAVTEARGRYIQLVQDYNTYIRQFPVNLTAMMFGHKAKPNFTVENEAQIRQAPTVDFGAAPAPQAPPPAPAPSN